MWSIERRENLLEDQSVLAQAKAGKASPQQLFDYYLGWINNPAITTHFVPKTDAETAYARDWGMNVAVNDVRAVIQAAKRAAARSRSAGTRWAARSSTPTRPGTSTAGPAAPTSTASSSSTAAAARAPRSRPRRRRPASAQLATSSPFLDLTGLGLPWSAGIFNAVGSNSALMDPDGPAILSAWSLLPSNLKPPVTATAEASYGYALDVKTGPESLALVQSHIGHLADSGDPRGWVDDGLTTALRAARVFGSPDFPDMDGTAWYHPRRLSIDAGAVNGGIPNAADATLDVHAIHGRQLKTPIYAFATSLGGDRVITAARAIAAQAHIPSSRVVTVNAAATNAHIDPIDDLPAKNRFLKTVVPFLRTLR